MPPRYPHPLRTQIDACSALLRLIKAKVVGRIDFESVADQVVAVECARAINTGEAIIALSLDGYGLQGEMLLRAMFEAIVTAHWASRHPDKTNERYPLNRKYLLQLWAAARRESGLYGDSEPEPLSTEEEAQSRRLFGQYGELPWTGVRFHEMVKRFVDEFDDGTGGVHLRAYRTAIHPMINWSLHSSGLNFWRIMPLPSAGLPTITLGPSDIGVRDALETAVNLLILCTGVHSDHFHVEFGPPLGKAVFDAWASFKGPEVIRQLGRNSPCPCKSGRKFKDCHDRLRHE